MGLLLGPLGTLCALGTLGRCSFLWWRHCVMSCYNGGRNKGGASACELQVRLKKKKKHFLVYLRQAVTTGKWNCPENERLKLVATFIVLANTLT
jgi:hypothetical protein